MTDRELMQMALDALEWCYDVTEWPANGGSAQDKAIEALRARLAQPEQPQIVWIDNKQTGNFLNMAPPQREWKGLTDEERYLNEARSAEEIEYAKAIEAKLKEKNEKL